MKMPGFTAELSLYKSNKSYQILGAVEYSNEIVSPSGLGVCKPGCLQRCRGKINKVMRCF